MTARPVLAVVAAGLVAAACAQSSSDDAAPADQDATHPPATDTSDNTDATGADDAEGMCRAELAELDRRDEAGMIDWEAFEDPEEEPTERELESVTITGDPFTGDVLADGERPTFPDFPDRLDVAGLSDVELVEAVDICYEVGLLADDEPTDDEAG